MFTPWRELVEFYNPGPSSRRCHSSCGTILAVSESEDSSEEEEEEDEEEERSREVRNGTSSAAAAAGGANENLNELKVDLKPKKTFLQNGSSPSPLIKANDLKNGFEDVTEITDIQGTEETDGGGVEETDGDGRGTSSSSPYFSKSFAGIGSILSSTPKGAAARPHTLTTASGCSVAASSVVARATGGGGSTVCNGGGEGIEESGVYCTSTTTTVRGISSPVSPVSLAYRKQTSITSITSKQALGVPPQIMRLASREITSCLDLAAIKSTDQAKEEKKAKKIVSTSPKPLEEYQSQTLPLTRSRSAILHKAKKPKILRKILTDPSIDPNALDHLNDTPLHKFVRKGKHDLLMVLLTESKGVRVNERDGDYQTPLHIAAAKGEKLIIKTLIAFGADLTALDAFNQSPVDVAKEKVKEMMKMFVARPKFIRSPMGHRGFSMINQNFACAPEMIGFYLNRRREARLCLDMENEIKRMLKDEEQNDVSQSAAGFMQLGDVYKWRKTKGEHPIPGSTILFLDGGGIRGLMSIEILMDIEARTGQRIIDLFDWIVGTSTGGIIALALVYGGMTLSDVRDLYIRMAPTIFGGNFLYASRRSTDMEKLMRETFGEKKMNCIKEPKVMITAVDIRKKTLDVEFFNNFEDNESTEVPPVWMVARATSAAPKHFTSFNGYVDGGVKANNPSEFAISRIRDYHDSKGLESPHFSLAISVGTGYFDKEDWKVSGNLDPTNVFTPKNLFDLLLNAISDSEEVSKKFANRCKQVGTKYHRFNPYLEKEIKANETDIKELLKLINKTKLYLLTEEVLSDLYQVNKAFSELGDLGETLTDYL